MLIVFARHKAESYNQNAQSQIQDPKILQQAGMMMEYAQRD